VAARLARLAATRQVLCVTHQACVAAHADHHLQMLKAVQNGRTGSKARVLAGPDRIDELARMLAGRHSNQSARALALDLMKSAARRPKRRAA
jgi:DNA repair protein RecN (Recombination protein N)